ncbi:MAG: zinc-binding dehydrogenase [Alphaproteobacteria bacterium]|nr:zinc-binding dehydrogenase [Alphaproteobacteria bacterium]
MVSTNERAMHCRRMGAVTIDRNDYKHWGDPPKQDDFESYSQWEGELRRFGRGIWDAVGRKTSPRIVVEHTGQDTLPTSLYVCQAGGMVVTCGATTGYGSQLDLRHLWMRQKRLQGSHFASVQQCAETVRLVAQGELSPCLSRVFRFEETAEAHQLMYDNRQPPGNMAVLVNAANGEGVGIGSI